MIPVHYRKTPSALPVGALVLVVLLLSGCASSDTGTVSLRLPTPRPRPTSTPAPEFVVAVTPQPTPSRTRAAPRPTSTRILPRYAPWVLLSPGSGPPESRWIRVRAGNLPKRSPLSLVWTAGRRSSPITTSMMSGPVGNLRASFRAPAAPPGTYHLTVEVNGVPYASATYHVVSRASLTAGVAPDAGGDRLTVRGKRFLAGESLLLVAYPIYQGRKKPIVLGTTRAGSGGTFTFTTNTRQLVPGAYDLRAWSQSALTAQAAETFFQVEV